MRLRDSSGTLPVQGGVGLRSFIVKRVEQYERDQSKNQKEQAHPQFRP
jgi:hypothetical protein